MASIMRRKPAPRRGKNAPRATKGQVRRVSPLKPGLQNARNWATAHMRAASYSKKRAARMFGAITLFVFLILFSGLWLGGFLPDIRHGAGQFTQNRLTSMGFVVKNVDVIGEGRIAEDEVRYALGVRSGDYLFDTDLRAAQQRVQELPWVKDAMVRRLWPNRYVVHIIERSPVALWQNQNQLRVVDTEGQVIEAALPEDFPNLPRIVGAGAAEKSQTLYDTLQGHPQLAGRVDVIIRVGNRRWDVQLKDGGARILLPEGRETEALVKLVTAHDSHGLLDLDIEVIDLRLSDRMIIRPRQDAGAPRYVRRGGRAT